VRYRARKTIRLGPVRLHFSERGFTGWGLRVGRWSWSATTGKHRIDTPGIGSVELGGPKRRRGAR
jgi:hypothetical protein